MRATTGLTALIVAAALSLTGCTFAPVLPEPSSSSRPAPSSTPTATPTPGDEPVVEPTEPDPATSELTCDDLLDAETTRRFDEAAASGWGPSEDFAERMIEQDNPIARFFELGGLACQWGFPETDAVSVYAWSPIASAVSTTMQGDIIEQGYLAEPHPDGRAYCTAPSDQSLGYDDCYLFGATDWYYSLERSQLGMLVAQVAAR